MTSPTSSQPNQGAGNEKYQGSDDHDHDFDSMYEGHDIQRARMQDKADGTPEADAFRAVLRPDARSHLQVQTESAQKVWSGVTAAQAHDYFGMLRATYKEGGQFVSNNVARAEHMMVQCSEHERNNTALDLTAALDGASKMRQGNDASAATAGDQGRQDGSSGAPQHVEEARQLNEYEQQQRYVERNKRVCATFPRLATIDTSPGRKTQGWVEEYTVDIEKLAHPVDWKLFVSDPKSMPLNKVRGSRNTFSIPPYKSWTQNWDLTEELQEGILMHLPRDDDTCV